MNIIDNNKLNKLLCLLILFFHILCIINGPKLLKTIVKKPHQKNNLIKRKKLTDSLKNPLLLIIMDFENLNLKKENISDLK